MSELNATATCLSGTVISFMTQEAAKLTGQIASILASFTDPMEALAETNVQQLADDVSSFSDGDVSGKLASMGAYIIVNRVKRELNNILKDVIQQHPKIGDRIQQIANISEAAYGIISLAVMLRKEAPYAAVKLVIDDILELLDAKETNLNQLKEHITQLNNTLLSAADNPTLTSTMLKEDFQEAVNDLRVAEGYLQSLHTKMSGSPAEYVEQFYDSAESAVLSAKDKISPQTDLNILDVGTAWAQGAVGVDFLSDAQVKLSSYAIVPIALQVECEMVAIERQTIRINAFLTLLPGIVPNYESASESVAMRNFRLKLLTQIYQRIVGLREDITSALSRPSLDRIALHSMSWTSRLNAIIGMMPKVQGRIESTLTTEEQELIDQMADELDAVIDSISDINSTNVVSGMESMDGLKSQVSTLLGQAKNLPRLMGTESQDINIEAFLQTTSEVVSGGTSSISESLSTISQLRSALNHYQTVPPKDKRIDQMLDLLELLGFNRARDLLKLGKFKELLDTTIDNASYIGFAIKCLIDAENLLEDTFTLSLVTGLRQDLEGQRISELSAAFDIIDSGKNAAILEIKTALEEGQENLATVRRIISTLKDIGLKTGQAVTEITRAAEGLEEELGEVLTSAGGSLNETLSGLDLDGLQGGCMGQVKH